MSTVSGLASKGDKGSSKQKYSSLNINNLYKGKSLENPKTAVAPKHGLQTLGKVGAGRRIPPPANLPSLKSESAGINTNVNLVPSGGQGWVKDKEESGTLTTATTNSLGGVQRIASPKLSINQEPVTAPSRLSSSTTVTPVSTSIASNASVVATGAASVAPLKTWSSITSTLEEGGPEKNFLAHQSPFFPQEFPKLDGGAVQQDENTKPSVDSSYGPGPSLRPQTEGSWSRGTATQFSGSQQVNSGNGVNGQPLPCAETETQGGQRNYPQVGLPQPPRSSVSIPMMNTAAVPVAANMLQTGPPSILPISPQYRPMMAPYMYGRNNAYPGAFVPPIQNFPGTAGPARIPYPYTSDNRMRQPPVRSQEEEPSFVRPAPPILTDKDLKTFDEILENETHDEWTLAQAEIDYNAKLVFSDDEEENASNQDGKSEAKSVEDKDEVLKDRPRNERDGSERDQDKDEKPRYRPPTQWSGPVPQRQHSYEYRPQPAPPPPAAQPTQPVNYSNPPSGYSAVRGRPEPADEDEIWRQRSRQHSDEMTAAVVRARQRREEEEKRFELSRQAAQEKARALEEKAKAMSERDKDSREKSLEADDRLALPREEKQVKDYRTINSYNNANMAGNFANKQFPKNIPPRFQKKLQQLQQQSGVLSHYGNRSENIVTAKVAPYDGSHQFHESKPGTGVVKVMEKARSDSQGSGHESSESESHWRSRDSSLRDNWRSAKAESKPHERSSESLKPEKPCDEVISPRRVETSRESLVHDKLDSPVRSDSRSSYLSRDSVRDRIDEVRKPPSSPFERQESFSGTSDKKGSKDEKSKKFERLDWASECDNVSIASSSSSQMESARKDGVLPTPAQKEPESRTDVKGASVEVKREDSSKDLDGREVSPQTLSANPAKDTNSDVRRVHASSDLPQLERIGDLKVTAPPIPSAPVAAAAPVPAAATIAAAAEKTKSGEDSDKLGGGVKAVHKDHEKRSDGDSRPYRGDRNDAPSQEHYRRNTKYEDRSHDGGRSRFTEPHYDNYGNRYDRGGGGGNFRGRSTREYRRSRVTNDKGYRHDKYGKGQGYPVRKLSKTRKQSHQSQESLESEELRKEHDHQASQKQPPFEGVKHTNEPSNVTSTNKSAPPASPSSKEDNRKSKTVASFRNMTRGVARTCGPSNYGPPPTKAAFDNTRSVSTSGSKNSSQESGSKSENKSSSDTSKSEATKSTHKDTSSGQTSSKDSNVTVNNARGDSSARNTRGDGQIYRHPGGGNEPNTAPYRTEDIPPRFLKKHNTYRNNRGGRNPPGGGSRPMPEQRPSRARTSSVNQESDIGNDEWETASESSDVAERRDGRKGGRESYPTQDNRNFKRNENRKKENTRPQQANSGQQSSNYRGHPSRNYSRGSGHPGSNRPGHLTVRNGPFPSSKTENSTVLAVNDVTLDNPYAIDDAIQDLKARQRFSKQKGQPGSIHSDYEDGFQKVSYKKRYKAITEGNENKKQKHEPVLSRPKLNSRSRCTKLPPRLAKQKENTRLNQLSNEAFGKITKEDGVAAEPSSPSEHLTKDDDEQKENKNITKTKPDHLLNAWSKPLSHAIQASNSIIVTTTAGSTGATVKCATKTTSVQQPLSASSKSSSFDQQDSGIDVSDQPASTASSQRSSPSSEENKAVQAANKTAASTSTPSTTVPTVKESSEDLTEELESGKPVCTVIFENKNFKAENAVLDKFGNKEDSINETAASKQPSTAVGSESSRKVSHACSDGNGNDVIKTDEEKSVGKLSAGFKDQKGLGLSIVNKAVGTPRSGEGHPKTPAAGSPSADELNLKIASVKKVWENLPSMPAVLENAGEDSGVNDALQTKYEEPKAKSTSSNVEQNTVLPNYSSANVQMAAQAWHNMRQMQLQSQEVNKGKSSNHGYSQQINNQLSHQSLLISSSSGNGSHLNSLDNLRQLQNYHLAGMPPISSPPNLIYNTQPQMAHTPSAPNIYQQFAHPMKTIPQVMAQFAGAGGPYHPHHQHIMSHQSNTIGQQNIYMSSHTPPNQSGPDRYRVNAAAAAAAHSQNLAAPHLLKTPYVQASTQALQAMHRLPPGSSNAFYSANQAGGAATGYFQQATAATPMQQQQYGYAQSQHAQLLTSTNPGGSQVGAQQSYRTVPVAIGRPPVENPPTRPSKYTYNR